MPIVGDARPPVPNKLSLKQLLAGEMPLLHALSFLLRMGAIGLGCPVEIEFALKLRRSPTAKNELHVLQVRPQSEVAEPASSSLRFRYLPSDKYAAVTSTRALGHGSFDDITDIIYVSPERMDMQKTKDIAAEISMLNLQLASAGRRYLLMAPGRWGTADTARGIPVSWMDIDNAGFIVETAVPGSSVPLSQGSHFFQNIISFGIGYATADPSGEGGEVADYAYWDSLPAAAEGAPMRHARHVRLEQPLQIIVDGVSRRGVVMKPGHQFELYVGQVCHLPLSTMRARPHSIHPLHGSLRHFYMHTSPAPADMRRWIRSSRCKSPNAIA